MAKPKPKERPKAHAHPERMEPAWYQLRDPKKALELKKLQDARSAAWKANRRKDAPPFNPEYWNRQELIDPQQNSTPPPAPPKPVMTMSTEPTFAPEPDANDLQLMKDYRSKSRSKPRSPKSSPDGTQS